MDLRQNTSLDGTPYQARDTFRPCDWIQQASQASSTWIYVRIPSQLLAGLKVCATMRIIATVCAASQERLAIANNGGQHRAELSYQSCFVARIL
jgi:hypothetical protein